MEFHIARAIQSDLAEILDLYHMAYTGTYPDQTFLDPKRLKRALNDASRFVFVAKSYKSEKIIGCLSFQYDHEHLLAKAGAAVVLPEYRGLKITQKLLKFGIEQFSQLEVLYITTRTVHKAAQVLTQNLGFKQLGIFPNVHKTSEYETHALAALYFNQALEKRHIEFKQHPDIYNLFELARENVELDQMSLAEQWHEKPYYGEVSVLEVIDSAPVFINKRYDVLKQEIDMAFFPFHKPNLLITSPAQNLEVFAYVNEVDKHCVIVGCKLDREVSFTELFLRVSNLLRDRGIRYIELILRANRLNIVDKIIKAKFIPCGYLPAFQLEGDKRFDYIVFSRSFEILDFNNLYLNGNSAKFLENYIKLWEKMHLGRFFHAQN